MPINADVDDGHLHTMKLRQHIDSGALSEKVQHHLPSHLAGISADPFCSHSMVCSKDIHRLLQRLGKISLSNGHHLRGNIFEHAKASKWLGQHIQMSTCTRKPLLARRLYRSDNLGDNRSTFPIHPTLFA